LDRRNARHWRSMADEFQLTRRPASTRRTVSNGAPGDGATPASKDQPQTRLSDSYRRIAEPRCTPSYRLDF
jgi:hypothetical protein